MARTSGNPHVVVAMIDGPVLTSHPDLAASIRELPGSGRSLPFAGQRWDYQLGTFTAGMLCARRDSSAPAICPGCTLLVRCVPTEATDLVTRAPRAQSADVAAAIIECVDEGARVINLGVQLEHPASSSSDALRAALDHAADRGVGIVAAADDDGRADASPIAEHRWVIPVVAYDSLGKPIADTNLSPAIERRGLGAPGVDITSLGTGSEVVTLTGATVPLAFVTGTIALLQSEFPAVSLGGIKFALTQGYSAGRPSSIPPLLNAWAAYQFLKSAKPGGGRV